MAHRLGSASGDGSCILIFKSERRRAQDCTCTHDGGGGNELTATDCFHDKLL